MADVEYQMQSQQAYQPGQQPTLQPGQQPLQPSQEPQDPRHGEQSCMRLNMDYIKSAPSILKISEIVLLLIAFSSGVSCCTGFFIWATIISLVKMITLYFFFAIDYIHLTDDEGKWLSKMMLNSLVWLVIFLVAYSLLIAHGSSLLNQGYILPTSYYLSVSCGFLACIVFFIDAAYYFILKRSRNQQ